MAEHEELPVMIIIYGETVKRRSSGFVAEFCPVCGQITQANVYDVHIIPHLFFVFEDSSSERCSTEFVCSQCKALLSVAVTLQRFRESPTNDIELLIEQTHPDVRSTYATQLEAADRLRNQLATYEASIASAIPAVIAIIGTILHRNTRNRGEIWSWFILILLLDLMAIALFAEKPTGENWHLGALITLAALGPLIGTFLAWLLFATWISPLTQLRLRRMLRHTSTWIPLTDSELAKLLKQQRRSLG